MRAAILTISTSKSRGEGHDQSGPLLARLAAALDCEVVAHELIADDRPLIEERLSHWAEDDRCDLILTSGGTGMAPDDVTPEATLAVIDREAPGIEQAIREASREHTRHWMLSRAVAGVKGATLIVNLPGSPAAVDQVGEMLVGALPHALAVIARRPTSH